MLEPRPARTSSPSRTFSASLRRWELYLLQCNSSRGSLQQRCLRSLLSATMKIPLCFQSGPYSWSVLHSASALAPIAVPIHRLPSRAPSRELIRDEGNSFRPGGFHETNRTLSNPVNPDCVPIQRDPSVVWAIAFGIPAKTPSSRTALLALLVRSAIFRLFLWQERNQFCHARNESVRPLPRPG
jgi:hypothetical protein